MFKRLFLLALVISSTFSLHAHDAGDIIVRGGVAHISPNDDSGNVLAVGDGVEVDLATGFGINATLMLSEKWGVELLASLPFEHDINATGDLSALGNIGSVKHLPPTLSAQYYFPSTGTMNPYVGFGLNYTLFFEEDTSSNLTNALGASSTDLSLSNSFGLAAQAGIDWELNNSWYINSSVYYIDIETDADVFVDGVKATTVNVNIDPWVLMLGVAKKF